VLKKILILERRLQNQQRQINRHKRYLAAWFYDHMIFITTGCLTGFLGVSYMAWKTGKLKLSPIFLIQIGRLLISYLAQYGHKMKSIAP